MQRYNEARMPGARVPGCQSARVPRCRMQEGAKGLRRRTFAPWHCSTSGTLAPWHRSIFGTLAPWHCSIFGTLAPWHPDLEQRSPPSNLPAQQRYWNQPRGAEFVHETLHREGGAQLRSPRGDQLLDLDLSDHVARAVGRLLQIEVLLVADGVRVEPEPSARRIGGGKRRR